MNVRKIVETLKEAAHAYYNGKPLKMDDDTYDALLERLKELDPEHPYLDAIGAPPVGTSVTLPYPMPSLDKIKPGQDVLEKFLRSATAFVLSEKLDGLSALWISETQRLYLRGDGIEGQDISHLVPHGIQGLSKGAAAVRGELVVPRSTVATLSRSWVNGIIHRKGISDELKKIRFVAYDLLKPANLTRSQQFEWLQSKGYEVPWWRCEPGTADLEAHLLTRRAESAYDTDGIVVGIDAIPVRPSSGKNPKDAVAFKMPLAEQSASTTIRAVLWAPSAQGYLIPRLEFDPVTIGGATIRFCTGHNARTVVQNGLGPGATIRIRRSGDVIPTLDHVTKTATPQLPEGSWEWTGSENVHIRSVGASAALTTAKLHHFLKTLGVPGTGPATASALVEGGIHSPALLWAASVTQLAGVLGPKTSESLHAFIRSLRPTELDLMIASSLMPRGVGESKLKALYAANSDYREWPSLTSVKGWTPDSLAELHEALPAYTAWRQTEIHWIPYPVNPVNPVNPAAPPKGVICFTGFRDKDLEAVAIQKGFTVASFTLNTTILAVPDGPVKESTKAVLARERGVRILSRNQLMQYLQDQ